MTREEKVARARELRAQGLLLRQIGERMGASKQTVSAWLTDPDGSRLRARKDSYRGTCRRCGAPTDGSNGPDAAPDECMSCARQRRHDERRWTPETIPAAMRRWAVRHGRQPKALDWENAGDDYPSSSTVVREMGWDAAIIAAGFPSQSRFKGVDRDEVVRLYTEEQIGCELIAERLGVSPHAVLWHLDKAGVPRRSHSESSRLMWARRKAAA